MKGFEMALWPNEYKTPGSFEPDARGFISIPISVLKELSIAYQKKEIAIENDTRNNVEYVKLGASAWKNDPSDGKRRPVIKAEIRNFSEEQKSLHDAAERKAQKDAAAGINSGASTAPAAEAATGWDIPF